MPAPRGNRNAKGNKGGGGPTLYQPTYPKQAYHLTLLGATDKQLAEAFSVSEQTINAWKKTHVEFALALKQGKLNADSLVAHALYHRALGYSHKAVKIYADPKTGAEVQVPYTERYPPDTTACIFWLKNRQRDMWRDRQEEAREDVAEISRQIAELEGIVQGAEPA